LGDEEGKEHKVIPNDDIVYYYGPAPELKKAAVSHLLEGCTEYLVIADVPQTELVPPDETHIWMVEEVPPRHSVTFVGMLIEKHVEMYGVSWLAAILSGVMTRMADRQTAISIVKSVEQELEKHE
jgi:hypothetical protein